jgi:hypothetical protein
MDTTVEDIIEEIREKDLYTKDNLIQILNEGYTDDD